MRAAFSATPITFALSLACAAGPALAQDTRACANEVRRLSEGLPLLHAEDREGDALAREPGARKGASLPDERRERIAGLVRQAGEAGERGDGQGCARALAEARALLREAGLGSGLPGSPTYGGGPTGAGSGGGDAFGSGGAAGAVPPVAPPGGAGAAATGPGAAGDGGGAGSGATAPTGPGGGAGGAGSGAGGSGGGTR